MASGISITSTGLGAAVKGLETLARTDRAKMFKQLGNEQVQNIRDRVNDRKSHTDGTYPASKRALRENGTTLLDTGLMLNAMKASGWTPDEVTVSFGSTEATKKAIWAQYGTRAFTLAKGAFPIMKNGGSRQVIAWSRKKAATPPRPFFGVSPSDMRKLMDKANGFWLDAIKKAGLKRG